MIVESSSRHYSVHTTQCRRVSNCSALFLVVHRQCQMRTSLERSSPLILEVAKVKLEVSVCTASGSVYRVRLSDDVRSVIEMFDWLGGTTFMNSDSQL
jgi:hypothetical protein